jgi:1-acyl-sn-glycerol-3-phosphate acyltransferase
LVTVPEAQTAARLLRGQVDCLRHVLTATDLAGDPGAFAPPPIKATDTAFVQFTSGSTGQPKGVVLTHQNILSNIRAMGEATRAGSKDIFVSWLPLYHDMGLIGAWLGSMYFAMQAVLLPPLTFLARPERWLWAIHEHGGTMSAAPNFGFELCASRVPDAALEGLDLATWRRAFNGAEPVSPATVRRFSERFAAYGFRAQAMAPVYGLAEAAVGLAFPPLDSGAVIDRICRGPFEREGRARPAETDDATSLEFVACGRPLPGYEIRIVGATGRELGEREVGRLEFLGPSATSGYLKDPTASEALFDGDWLDSGDLAYIAGADVYLTSRTKDVIIRAGRNIYPYEVEEAVGDIDGVRKGCVAVFGSTNPVSGTEKLVVMAETREEEPSALERMAAAIATRVNDVLGMPADDVVLAPPRTVLKTSSGKIRRAASREVYERGDIGKRARSVWWQVTRLALSSAASRWRVLRRTAAEICYGIYVEVIFFLIVIPVWIGVALLPPGPRWALIRRGARTLFRAAGIPFLVDGIERLPHDTACVYVSNHASYLDGVVAIAGLPGTFSFAAKAELEERLVSRIFLRRIGAHFVERTDVEKGLADARAEVRAAQRGESLYFFPEGGLTREPGLRPFHLGAFAAAAEAGVPVVPVTIRGTRSILRGGSWFPRRGTLTLVVAEPVYPDGSDWAASVRLRDEARARMLKHLGEPDISVD